MTTDPLRPSVADVALLIRARTKDADGREVGTFTDETRPTDEQVEEHISAAVALLSPRWPIAIDDSYYLAVQRLTAYRAAMQIEKSISRSKSAAIAALTINSARNTKTT
jgi:hypothetical protein